MPHAEIQAFAKDAKESGRQAPTVAGKFVLFFRSYEKRFRSVD